MNTTFAAQSYSTMDDAKQAKIKQLKTDLYSAQKNLESFEDLSADFPHSDYYRRQIHAYRRVAERLEIEIASLEQSAEDFQAHVASMESAIAGAWVTVETYTRSNGGSSHSFLTVADGVIVRSFWCLHYQYNNTYFERDYTTDDLTGQQTWGLALRDVYGYRKIATHYENLITGEISTVNPLQ